MSSSSLIRVCSYLRVVITGQVGSGTMKWTFPHRVRRNHVCIKKFACPCMNAASVSFSHEDLHYSSSRCIVCMNRRYASDPEPLSSQSSQTTAEIASSICLSVSNGYQTLKRDVLFPEDRLKEPSTHCADACTGRYSDVWLQPPCRHCSAY